MASHGPLPQEWPDLPARRKGQRLVVQQGLCQRSRKGSLSKYDRDPPARDEVSGADRLAAVKVQVGASHCARVSIHVFRIPAHVGIGQADRRGAVAGRIIVERVVHWLAAVIDVAGFQGGQRIYGGVFPADKILHVVQQVAVQVENVYCSDACISKIRTRPLRRSAG